MLCARLQAVLRGGNPGARYPMTSVGVCGALPRLRGRRRQYRGALPSHGRRTKPTVGPCSVGAKSLQTVYLEL